MSRHFTADYSSCLSLISSTTKKKEFIHFTKTTKNTHSLSITCCSIRKWSQTVCLLYLATRRHEGRILPKYLSQPNDTNKDKDRMWPTHQLQFINYWPRLQFWASCKRCYSLLSWNKIFILRNHNIKSNWWFYCRHSDQSAAAHPGTQQIAMRCVPTKHPVCSGSISAPCRMAFIYAHMWWHMKLCSKMCAIYNAVWQN